MGIGPSGCAARKYGSRSRVATAQVKPRWCSQLRFSNPCRLDPQRFCRAHSFCYVGPAQCVLVIARADADCLEFSFVRPCMVQRRVRRGRSDKTNRTFACESAFAFLASAPVFAISAGARGIVTSSACHPVGVVSASSPLGSPGPPRALPEPPGPDVPSDKVLGHIGVRVVVSNSFQGPPGTLLKSCT